MGDNEESNVPQKLMSAEEVYVYKIPPLKTSGGHRAEDWNLATPLKTCSLLVEQRGKVLYILFTHEKSIFAMAKMDMATPSPTPPLEQFVESTVDSSRYFAVRITDEKSGRDAWIGFGFRERDEATDFRESLNHYIKSVKRDTAAELGTAKYDEMGQNLSLKEGEKIHIELGNSGKSKKVKDNNNNKPAKKSSGGGGLLLKKPPPPGSTTSPPPPPPPSQLSPKETKIRVKDGHSIVKDISISFGDINLDDHSVGTDESDSTGAVGALSTDGDLAWTDFEGVEG